VTETAHVRVHQIWIGDRANDATAATYSANDLTIVERDIGRLAKHTFDMGGGGDLLSLALYVPPWEDLHELSREELRLTNLVTCSAGQPQRSGDRADAQTGAGSLREQCGYDRNKTSAGEINQDG
jgi:hypothetical protein